VLAARLGERRDGFIGTGDVALDRNAADLFRHGPRAIEVDVEAGDFGARLRQHFRGGGAEA